MAIKNPLQATVVPTSSASDPRGISTLSQTNSDNVDSLLSKTGTNPKRSFTDEGSFPNSALRWNKTYPYQMLILEKENGTYKTRYTFTLPVNPESLQISTPFAITGEVTLGGYHEQHNGTPINLIRMAGSTGVIPLKGATPPRVLGSSNLLQGVFVGTINNVGKTLNSVSKLVGTNSSPNLISDSDTDILTGSGYYQFRLLQKFLEGYAHLKTQAKSSQYRLALAIWKDQSVYLVTPQTFDVSRVAGSPWEYNYQIALKAFGRVVLGSGPGSVSPYKPPARDPSLFAQMLNKIDEARAVLVNGSATLRAAGADVDNLLNEPMRQLALFCKDAVGVVVSAAELPASVVKSMKSAIIEVKSIKGIFERLGPVLDEDLLDLKTQAEELAVLLGKVETGAASNYKKKGPSDPGPQNYKQGSSTGGEAGSQSSSARANKSFDNPDDLPLSFLSAIQPAQLNLSPAVQKSIAQELERIRRLTRLDFEKMRDNFVAVQRTFANAIGAGSDSYDSIYGTASSATTRTPTDDEYEMLFALNQLIIETSRMAASGTIDRTRTSTIESVAGMASRSGIAFTVPTSKFAIPFPYGMSLEQLSTQYLGSPDRWMEIVALNGLRSPFIDEVGFTLPLLASATGNELLVSDATNFYIGQAVTLSAVNVVTTKARISKISQVSPGVVALALDTSGLEAFTVAAHATLHAFLPDTVNSQQLIYIPSPDAADEEDFFTKSIPGVDQFDPMIEAGGVDLLLTTDGDMVITPDGDQRLAIGLTNIIQGIRQEMKTPQGSIYRHQEYGLRNFVGASTADVDARDVALAVREMLARNKAVTSIEGVSIVKDGPTLRASLAVGISGVQTPLPISLDIIH